MKFYESWLHRISRFEGDLCYLNLTVGLEVGNQHAGPIHEINFWRERSIDLGGIREQLDDPSVASIVSVLEHAKSSYLPPFLNLRNLIQREAIAAEDNLRFLLCLENPCQVFHSSYVHYVCPMHIS